MNLVQKLHRIGGVATRAHLIELSSEAEFRRAVAGGAISRDSHGRYSLPIATDALRAANRLTGVVSHRSAALHWGWEVKFVPEQPDVTVRRKRHLSPAQREGVAVHWADLSPAEVVQKVTTRDRTLIDCMRSLPFDEALAIADSALRHRAVTKRHLVDLADSITGPGARQARRVARAATHLAANPFESVLRAIALDVRGLGVEPQVVIADDEGQGRPDLVDEVRRLVIEAESHSWHSRRGALRRDCRRYTKLVLLGWRVLRFAWEDVMFHQDYVRACLEAAVALPVRQAASAYAAESAA